MKTAFLTGATGTLGSAVLKYILTETNLHVKVLIRSSEPTKKLKEILDFYELDSTLFRTRIEIVNSDAESPQYGMSNEGFDTFSKSLDLVFHCAANVDLSQTRESALGAATKLIENILKILEINKECKLEMISTVGINGTLNSSLKEERLLINRSFFNSYEYSKAKIEESLYKKIDEGYKINIHRPSMIVGDQTHGQVIHFQIFHFLLRLVSGEITKGLLPPILHRKLDTIPSDFAAMLIVKAGLASDLHGHILHECSGPQMSFSLGQISSIVRAEKIKWGYSLCGIKIIPMFVLESIGFIAKYFPMTAKWNKRTELLPQLLHYASQDQIFENSKTRLIFSDLAWPEPSSYLIHSIQYYLKKRTKGGTSVHTT